MAGKELPIELYWHIFSFFPTEDRRCSSWLPLTLTSRHLRAAALSCPSFSIDVTAWSQRHRSMKQIKDSQVISLLKGNGEKDQVVRQFTSINFDLCPDLTPAVMETLAESPSAQVLRKLRIAHCKKMVTKESLTTLLNACPNLEELALINCPSFDVINTILAIPTLRQSLKKLEVTQCSVQPPESKDIQLNLTSLDLSHTDVTWETVLAMGALSPKLKTLRLGECQELGRELGFTPLGQSCPDLEELRIIGLGYNKSSIKRGQGIPKSFPHLKILDLSHAPCISSYRILKSLAKKCPHLEELYVQGGTNLRFPTEVIQNCKNLRCLNITSMLNNSDKDLQVLAQHAGAKLTYFGVGDSCHVTWQGLQELIAQCPNLEVLSMTKCKSVPPTWNPLPPPGQEPPVMLKSVREVFEKLEKVRMHATRTRPLGDMDVLLSGLEKRFPDKGGLPEGFVEFCKLWGGRFPINHYDMHFMSNLFYARDEEDTDDPDSVFVLLNEYGNNDTVWYTVLDPTGAIGPKGSVLEFSAWDTYLEDGGYCDSFVRLHMGPNDFSKDSHPIIYEDFLSYLNALLIRASKEVGVFLATRVFRARGCPWGWEEWIVDKAFEIVDNPNVSPNALGDTFLKMAVDCVSASSSREEDSAATPPIIIKRYIQMLLARGADPRQKNVFGVSALDSAARYDLLHLFEPLTAEEEEKVKQELEERENKQRNN